MIVKDETRTKGSFKDVACMQECVITVLLIRCRRALSLRQMVNKRQRKRG